MWALVIRIELPSLKGSFTGSSKGSMVTRIGVPPACQRGEEDAIAAREAGFGQGICVPQALQGLQLIVDEADLRVFRAWGNFKAFRRAPPLQNAPQRPPSAPCKPGASKPIQEEIGAKEAIGAVVASTRKASFSRLTKKASEMPQKRASQASQGMDWWAHEKRHTCPARRPRMVLPRISVFA